MNPPILPWVTDFTSEIDHNSEWRSGENVLASPWRDLTKVWNVESFLFVDSPRSILSLVLLHFQDQISIT